MRCKTLYHWTHCDVLDEILHGGLLPAKATGARAVTWLCGIDAVWGLIQHVAVHHSWHTADMILLAVQVPADLVRRGPQRDRFTSAAYIPPTDITLVFAVQSWRRTEMSRRGDGQQGPLG